MLGILYKTILQARIHLKDYIRLISVSFTILTIMSSIDLNKKEERNLLFKVNYKILLAGIILGVGKTNPG